MSLVFIIHHLSWSTNLDHVITDGLALLNNLRNLSNLWFLPG